MSQVTESLARAIINGAGATQNELEQLARIFLAYSELLGAVRALNENSNLGDGVYDLRERVDLSELAPGESSWDHPRVKAYGLAVDVIERHLKTE